jgi:acyl carrier protein
VKDGQVGESRIREILAEHGRLRVDVATLGDEADLYGAGLSSHAAVNVMIALEEAFDIEFPDSLLRKSTFASVDAIRAALAEVTGPASH